MLVAIKPVCRVYSVLHTYAVTVCLLLWLVAPASLANADDKARIKGLLASMTLEQKVGQMIQGEIKSVTPDDVTKYHLGSILNGGGSFPNGDKNATLNDWLSTADQYYKIPVKVVQVFPLFGVQTRFMAITT